jgi:squalene cyclase
MQKSIAVLIFAGIAGSALAETHPKSQREAIEKGLKRVEAGAAHYLEMRKCFSCHHQALPILNMAIAPKRGFAVEPAILKKQVDRTVAYFHPQAVEIGKGLWMPGGSPMAAYALVALGESGYPADELTSSLVGYLVHHQEKEGCWQAVAQRPPSEGSRFAATALALRSLQAYRPVGNDKESRELRYRADAAIVKAKEWLLTAKPETTEDKAFALHGLVWSAADRKRIDEARDVLLREQRADGSWGQLSGMAGDAYATGTVLTALHAAGLRTDDPANLSGIQYLLSTQQDDGSWIVTTRAKPVQVFFDNGDAGGKSQFISFTATNWAVLALLGSMRH